MAIRGVVIHALAVGDVRFGRMQVAARWIDAERPCRHAGALPGGQPERITQQIAQIGMRSVRPRRERNLARAGKRPEWIRLRRPVEISERAREPMEMMLGAVVITNDGVDRHQANVRRGTRRTRRPTGAFREFCRFCVDRRLGERRNASIDFVDGLLQLRAPTIARRGLQLTLELGARQPQRLARADLLRILDGLAALRLALAIQLLDPFLDPRVGVNQSLSRITHGAHYLIWGLFDVVIW